MKKLLGFLPVPILMLLADVEKLCTIPENDSFGNIPRLMLKYLTGQCAFYLEFYKFFKERVLAGAPDYGPAEVVDGDITVMPAAFGRSIVGMNRRVCYSDGSAKMWGDTNMASFTELEGATTAESKCCFSMTKTKSLQ